MKKTILSLSFMLLASQPLLPAQAFASSSSDDEKSWVQEGSLLSPSPPKSSDSDRSMEVDINPNELESFYQAIEDGDLEMVREFIKNSPHLLHGYNEDGWSPIHMAAYLGELEIL